MDLFWNSKVLKPPPVDNFKYRSTALDINNVKSILEGAIETFIIPDELRLESVLMRRVIYKLKLQFRLDKGFKLFENTNRNLDNLFSFRITKDLMYLLDQIPKRYEIDLYLPSKQMLEYLLVRLQAYSQVCSRVVESSFKTVDLMKGRLVLGHQWELATVIISICSRIWQYCRHLTTKCCLTYNDLLPLLDKLQITGTKWLPENYEFPKDLITWLDYDWLLAIPDVILQLPLELPIFNLLDDDDNETSGSSKYNKRSNSGPTIIIADDTDDSDEDVSCVKFVRGLNNSIAKLTNKKLKRMSKNIINIDSDSDIEIVNYEKHGIPTSGSFENLLELVEDEDDVEIVEINDETLVDNLDSDDASGDDVASSKQVTAIIETNGHNQSGNDIQNIVLNASNNNKSKDVYEFCEEENNLNNQENDIGVPISRNSKIKIRRNTELFENIEVVNRGNDQEMLSEDEDGPEKQQEQQPEKENESEEENNQEMQVEEENNQQIESVDAIEEDLKPIRTLLTGRALNIKGHRIKLNTNQRMLRFLEKENSLREKGTIDKCLFSNLHDDDWNCIDYQIKYLIAISRYEFQFEDEFLHKARTILREFKDFSDDLVLENPVILPLNREYEDTFINTSWKKYLINSIDSVKKLHIFLEKEIFFRQQCLDYCIFCNLNDSSWLNLFYKLKGYIIMAVYKPIKSNQYLRNAKRDLLRMLKKGNESDSDSEDSDKENSKIESRRKSDKLYASIAKGKNWDVLFEYFFALEVYKDIPFLNKKSNPIEEPLPPLEDVEEVPEAVPEPTESDRNCEMLFEIVKAQASYPHPFIPKRILKSIRKHKIKDTSRILQRFVDEEIERRERLKKMWQDSKRLREKEDTDLLRKRVKLE